MQLVQDCTRLILDISSNELQVCIRAKSNVLGVPITLPYMALWASIYGEAFPLRCDLLLPCAQNVLTNETSFQLQVVKGKKSC